MVKRLNGGTWCILERVANRLSVPVVFSQKERPKCARLTTEGRLQVAFTEFLTIIIEAHELS